MYNYLFFAFIVDQQHVILPLGDTITNTVHMYRLQYCMDRRYHRCPVFALVYGLSEELRDPSFPHSLLWLNGLAPHQEREGDAMTFEPRLIITVYPAGRAFLHC